MRKYNVNGRFFNFTRQRAWEIVKNYGKKIGLSLHPHMFRYGLVIYLLQHGVSDKIIARRLGHSSAATTIKCCMVITPEIERDVLKVMSVIIKDNLTNCLNLKLDSLITVATKILDISTNNTILDL